MGTHAVIFVIDSTDKKTELLSKAELFNLLCNEVNFFQFVKNLDKIWLNRDWQV